MVFCDGCNIAVHQCCYGVELIPEGNWFCDTCDDTCKEKEPPCILCPNKGGAMKPVAGDGGWAHLACALWIPEATLPDTVGDSKGGLLLPEPRVWGTEPALDGWGVGAPRCAHRGVFTPCSLSARCHQWMYPLCPRLASIWSATCAKSGPVHVYSAVFTRAQWPFM